MMSSSPKESAVTDITPRWKKSLKVWILFMT